MNQLSEGLTQICSPTCFSIVIGNLLVLLIRLCFRFQTWTYLRCSGLLRLTALLLPLVTVALTRSSAERRLRQKAGIALVVELVLLVLVRPWRRGKPAALISPPG